MHAVLQCGQKEKPEDRSPNRAAPAKNGSATKNGRSNRIEFVTGAHIGFSETEMSNIHDCRHAGNETREHVNGLEARANRDARVARPTGRKSNGVKCAPPNRTMQENRVSKNDQYEKQKLHRYDSRQVTLPEKQKLVRKTGVTDGAVSDAFRNSAKKRIRTERDNERRQVGSRD